MLSPQFFLVFSNLLPHICTILSKPARNQQSCGRSGNYPTEKSAQCFLLQTERKKMKYYSIIAFISAVVHSVIGILIGSGKIKGFVNIICKNPEQCKILSGYFIAIGVIMLSYGLVALIESQYSIIYLALASVAVSVILSLIRRENI